MSAQAFGAFVQLESDNASVPMSFAKVVHRDSISPGSPSTIELDQIEWGKRLNGPQPDHDISVPPTPRQLEASQPSTPKRNQPVDALLQSVSNPSRNKWRVASATLVFLLMGMNDAATGALIPYIELHYHIGYAVVSLIFITYALGFISAAPLVGILDAKLGRSRLYILSNLLLCIGYITVVCTPPFAVVVAAFLFLGFGVAAFLAVTNSWIVNLMNGTVVLGCCHGIYGLGGVISPLVATAMVSRGVIWSRFYLVLLLLATVSIPFMGWSYRGFEKDAPVQLLSALERTASRQNNPTREPSKGALLAMSLKNKTTLLGALFIFFYQGGEVAVSGWVISYLISYRGGNPSQVGNVTAGFWGGITLGRFVLTPIAHRIGEKRAVIGLIIAAAVFQALVWAVPNIISNAVAESLVGLFLGPVYPCATAVFSKLWPRDIQLSGLSLVASMGSSGGAVVPFVTGIMAQRLSTVVLHPIVLFSFAIMTISWLLLPKIEKRRD